MITRQYNSAFRPPHSVIKTIFIVHDPPIVWHRVREFLERRKDLEIAGETNTAREAIELIDKFQPDVVIVDITVGARKGIKLIRKIVRNDGIPVLVVSKHNETLYAERVLRVGARGYVPIDQDKPFDVLLQAIYTVLDGNIYLSDKVKSELLKLVAADCGRNELGNNSATRRRYEAG